MDALEYLAQVEEKAKQLYESSDQGEWESLHPALKDLWIMAADKEMRPVSDN